VTDSRTTVIHRYAVFISHTSCPP